MKHSQKRKYVQLTLLLSVFFLLIGFLSQAGACLALESTCAIAPRVNSCHTFTDQALAAKTCCKSEACHRATATPRDIGGPYYSTGLDASHPVVHDPRCPTPNNPLHSKEIKVSSNSASARLHTQLVYLPNQTLNNLRTVVLRH